MENHGFTVLLGKIHGDFGVVGVHITFSFSFWSFTAETRT